MPIYEYVCANCGHNIDVIQKISDPKLTNCPKCDADSLEKLVSAPSFRLKGTGWYETDFKNSNNKSANSSAKDAKSTSKSDETKAVK